MIFNCLFSWWCRHFVSPFLSVQSSIVCQSKKCVKEYYFTTSSKPALRIGLLYLSYILPYIFPNTWHIPSFCFCLRFVPLQHNAWSQEHLCKTWPQSGRLVLKPQVVMFIYDDDLCDVCFHPQVWRIDRILILMLKVLLSTCLPSSSSSGFPRLKYSFVLQLIFGNFGTSDHIWYGCLNPE